MKIGLDFDGVISDCGRLKSDGAKKIYGVDIPPKRFKTELVVGDGILTLEQYKYLQKQIYENPDIGLSMLPVEGIFEFIPKLQQKNHDLVIVTSRNELSCDIAREWMKINNLPLNITGTAGKTKTEAYRGLNVYIDDDLDKLESLVNVVPNRFLFSWEYNQHIEVSQAIAQRVYSWKHFYQEVSKISLTV